MKLSILSAFALFASFLVYTNHPVHAQQLNWEAMSYPYNGDINLLASDSHERIYAATLQGLCFSTDDGMTWHLTDMQPQQSNGYDSVGNIYGLAFDHSDNVYATLSNGRVYESLDGGNSWEPLQQAQLPFGVLGRFSVEQFGCGTLQTALKVNLLDSNRNWVPALPDSILNRDGLESSFDTNGFGDVMIGMKNGSIYLSNDNGLNWKRIHNADGYVFQSCVGFDGPSTFYFGAGGMFYRSFDHGKSWDSIATQTPDVATLCVTKDHRLFLGTRSSGEIYTSSDRGRTWSGVFGLGYGTYQIMETEKGSLLALTGSAFGGGNLVDFMGTVRSEDGLHWTFSNEGLSNTEITSLITSSAGVVGFGTSGPYDATVYNLMQYNSNHFFPLSGLEVSADLHGHLYSVSSLVLQGSDSVNLPDPPMVHDYQYVQGRSTITTLADGHFVTFSQNIFWEYDSKNSSWDSITLLNIARPLTVLESDRLGRLYAIGSYAPFIRSLDGGHTWDTIPTPYPDCTMLTVCANGDVYANFDGPNQPYLYKSTDQCRTWTSLNLAGAANGSNYLGNQWLAVTHSGTIYAIASFDYASTNRQLLFFSTNDGATWSLAVNDPRMYNVTAITLDSTGYLYVGTTSNGLFRAKLPETSSVKNESASTFSLHPNYPNPFQTSTSIEFDLPRASSTTLTVYNSAGMVVRQMSREFGSAGSHSITFASESLPSGIYFYELSGGGFIARSKMILMK
jgi:photosystem II stability/assembly factor-like uncharacterized protein